MLLFLKILTTVFTALLGIFAVNTDFLDKATHRLKPLGKWYIAIFICSVLLSFLFTQLSDNENNKKTEQHFNNTILKFDSLLGKTKDSLNTQFRRLNDLNNLIDWHVNSTSKKIQKQLDQTNTNERNINALTMNIDNATKDNVKQLKRAIISLNGVDSNQLMSLNKLAGLSDSSKMNLREIQKVFARLNSLGTEMTFNSTQVSHIKVDALHLMNFATEDFKPHSEEVKAFEIEIQKAYEEAKTKKNNVILLKMWDMLVGDSDNHLLGGFFKRWEANNKLSEVFIKDYKGIVGKSFDMIIVYENALRQ